MIEDRTPLSTSDGLTGMMELRAFCHEVRRQAIAMEMEKNPANSIECYCRMDVGIYKQGYFINEITRAPGSSLYLDSRQVDPVHLLPMITDVVQGMRMLLEHWKTTRPVLLSQ